MDYTVSSFYAFKLLCYQGKYTYLPTRMLNLTWPDLFLVWALSLAVQVPPLNRVWDKSPYVLELRPTSYTGC